MWTDAEAATAQTNIEVEGRDADEAGTTYRSDHKQENKPTSDHKQENKPTSDHKQENKPTSFTFRTDKQEATEVEGNALNDSSSSFPLNSDSLEYLKDKYNNNSFDSLSTSRKSTKEEEKKRKTSKSASYSTDTFKAASDEELSAQQEVNPADADTADDVSDIETDVEWPRKIEDVQGNKEPVVDSLPPKPKKNKGLQGILTPKKQRKQPENKKKTTFKIEKVGNEDESSEQSPANQLDVSDILSSDDGESVEERKLAKKKLRKKKEEKLSPKNYDIGLVAFDPEEEESGAVDHLTLADASDRTKDGDIPEVSVKRSGITLFSDRVEEEPCREHVTVGGVVDEDESDERGTESDERDDEAKSYHVTTEPERGDQSESGRETSVDVVAQYAAHLSELDDRVSTESSPDVDISVEMKSKETEEDISTLPTIVVDNNTEGNKGTTLMNGFEGHISDNDDKDNLVQETLANIKPKHVDNDPRRLSAGGESLLSVPNSDVHEPGSALWTSRTPQEENQAKTSEPPSNNHSRTVETLVTDDGNTEVEKQIPVILVNEESEPSKEMNCKKSNTEHKGSGSPSDTETATDSDSDSSSSSSSDTHSENSTVKPTSGSRTGASLVLEDSTPVPTIITEHVD